MEKWNPEIFRGDEECVAQRRAMDLVLRGDVEGAREVLGEAGGESVVSGVLETVVRLEKGDVEGAREVLDELGGVDDDLRDFLEGVMGEE